MHLENFMGRLLNQLICNRANSSGKGPAHLGNVKRKVKLTVPTGLEQSQLIWKQQKRELMKMINFIMNFFVIFFCIFLVIYFDLRLY